jgi:glycerophosphoryl diester phosphodiesterase
MMHKRAFFWRMVLAVIGVALLYVHSPVRAGESHAEQIRRKLHDSRGDVVVIAHRGCHNPAPQHGLSAAPENSLAALEHCIRLGVDVMETDVRMTADGYLVIIHDDKVDRTTTGSGKVAQMTLGQLGDLRLRENSGGPTAPATDERPVTLDEMLKRARGRILLNLDVKASIYAEVVDAVVRAGMRDEVIVKAEVGIGSYPLAAMPPFDRVPFMPIIMNARGNADLAAIAQKQVNAANPVAFELPKMSWEQLGSIVKVAQQHHLRLLNNTLDEGFIEGCSDSEALRDPDKVWGRLIDAGVSMFQTDQPEALLGYLKVR